jgi:sugar O-acyltransferase (sialic acid O-acetyltransferase NeuD family)
MSRTSYIFGNGGHAHVIADLIARASPNVTFVVRGASAANELEEGTFFDSLDRHSTADIFVGIGDNAVRQRLCQQLIARGVRLARCIAPNAYVAASAEIGDGTVLCPGSVVNARAVLGAGVIVNTLSSVDHDCRIGDYCQITAGVTLGGGVTLGSNCLLGIKSAIIPNMTLGNDVQVMAGALVAGSFGDRVVVGGSPARLVKAL